MRLLDTILGRTRAVPADLDRLFALPSAAVTLEAALGLTSTGTAGVCFKPADGAAFDSTGEELLALLGLDHTPARVVDDRYGYRWVVLTSSASEDLVGAAHLVNATLADRGFGPQLLCSAFAFAKPDRTTPVLLVYLYKRGTFYPFAPSGPQTRDTQLELSVRAALGTDLPVEADLTRWFALWDAPLLDGLHLPASPEAPPAASASAAPQPATEHHGCC